MTMLTKQELHNLAMNIAGKELEKQGFEFLAINSSLAVSPQFVCVDAKNLLYFVVVKPILYPENPDVFDKIWAETFKTYAKQKNATVLYASVGLANASNYELPITQTDDYIVNFKGFIEL